MIELFIWMIIIMVGSVVVTTGGYFLYSYLTDKLRNVELGLLQSEIDATLKREEGHVGTNLRARVLVFEKESLKPVLIRPERVAAPEKSEAKEQAINDVIDRLARIVKEREVPWYASEIPPAGAKDETSEPPRIRGVAVVPIKNSDGAYVGIVSLESTTPFSVKRERLEEALKPVAKLGGTILR